MQEADDKDGGGEDGVGCVFLIFLTFLIFCEVEGVDGADGLTFFCSGDVDLVAEERDGVGEEEREDERDEEGGRYTATITPAPSFPGVHGNVGKRA